jgi:hypothetical protein
MLLAHSPFGKESRVQILRQHLAEADSLTPETAWQFIYRELLWIDGSTGLAHLYESDKAQPGRPWYNRTVIFTKMLCDRFGSITQEELKGQIDRLFRACLEKLIHNQGTVNGDSEIVEALTNPETSPEVTESIIEAVEGSGQEDDAEKYVPDADLVAEFANLLVSQANMTRTQADAFAHKLVARARFYFTVERKRQNVLGEGFEDLLQILMMSVGKVPQNHIVIRKRANTLPGFQGATNRERIEAPDIAIIRDNKTEMLASVKWSLRHDRQKQLSDELDCYVDLLSQEKFPKYILITNEYDPGRLVNADGLARRGQRLDHIYHINLDFLLGVLQDHERGKDLEPLIRSGRLRSVEDFLRDLAQEYISQP